MASLYKTFVRPLAFTLPPEFSHNLALSLLARPWFARGIAGRPAGKTHAKTLWGLKFPNPVGLAAGFDKNGRALPAWEHLGFGFMEIGTVTRHAQAGNPRPRLFRLPRDGALINRLGFPNEGADAVALRLARYRAAGTWPSVPVGINIGKSKITPLEEAAEDYLYSFRKLRAFADYVAVNVSSPNTPGLRQLQSRDALGPLLSVLAAENRAGKPVPLLLKIAPDLERNQISEILRAIQDHGLSGIIATNTTVDKTGVPLKEEGGLSGRPLRGKSTDIIRFIANETGGKLPIIGAGGVFTADDAREKLDAGASLLQIYTGLIYEGPRAPIRICKNL